MGYTHTIEYSSAWQGMKYWLILQYKWTLKALWEEKRVRHKIPQIAQFYLYEMSRTDKFWKKKKNESVLVVAGGWQWGWWEKENDR